MLDLSHMTELNIASLSLPAPAHTSQELSLRYLCLNEISSVNCNTNTMLDLLAMDGWLYSLTDLSPLLRHARSMILLTLLCVHGQLVMARFDL